MSCSNIVCFLAFQNSQGINITYLIAREVVHRKSIVEVVKMLLILSDHNDTIMATSQDIFGTGWSNGQFWNKSDVKISK